LQQTSKIPEQYSVQIQDISECN